MSAGGPTWTSPSKALPFIPSPTANFKAQFSAKGMARAMFKPGAVIPLVAAPLIQAALEAACVKVAGGKMVLEDGAVYETCDMSKQDTQTLWRIQSPAVTTWETSPSNACTVAYLQQAATYESTPDSIYTVTGGAHNAALNRCDVTYTQNKNGTLYQNLKGYYGYATTTQTTGAPAGQPITAAQAQAQVEQTLQQWTQADFLYGYQTHNTPELLSELVQTVGVEPSGVSADGTHSITEPDQVTQTQNADGSKTVTTTKTDHQITYQNPPTSPDGSPASNVTINITYNTNTHTEVKNIAQDGTVTNVKTTDDAKQDQPKEDNQCKANPDRMAALPSGLQTRGRTLTGPPKTWSSPRFLSRGVAVRLPFNSRFSVEGISSAMTPCAQSCK
jgi:hypothetical protein